MVVVVVVVVVVVIVNCRDMFVDNLLLRMYIHIYCGIMTSYWYIVYYSNTCAHCYDKL